MDTLFLIKGERFDSQEASCDERKLDSLVASLSALVGGNETFC